MPRRLSAFLRRASGLGRWVSRRVMLCRGACFFAHTKGAGCEHPAPCIGDGPLTAGALVLIEVSVVARMGQGLG